MTLSLFVLIQRPEPQFADLTEEASKTLIVGNSSDAVQKKCKK